MNHVVYEETQRFGLWVYLLMFVLIVGLLIAFVGLSKISDNPNTASVPVGALSFAMAILLLTGNLMLLRVRVRENDVYVSLGVLFPMLWRRVGLDTIVEERVVTYRPLRDAGGWGVRLGMFEGKPASYFNARGNRGVLLTTANRPFIIGSQNPEPLAEAIARAREQYGKVHC
jgi:hypothetical protein